MCLTIRETLRQAQIGRGRLVFFIHKWEWMRRVYSILRPVDAGLFCFIFCWRGKEKVEQTFKFNLTRWTVNSIPSHTALMCHLRLLSLSGYCYNHRSINYNLEVYSYKKYGKIVTCWPNFGRDICQLTAKTCYIESADGDLISNSDDIGYILRYSSWSYNLFYILKFIT